MNRFACLIPAAACLLLTTGCGESEPTESATAPTSAGSTQHGWLLASAPEEATSVANAKELAQEGDVVAIRGRIGGSTAPLRSDSPIFVVVDMDLPHCGEMEEDHCPTPWDYCCETSESLAASSATVQLVNDAGEALDVNPIAAGLEALDEVIIVGTVAPRPNGEVLIIRATGVHRVGG